MFKTTIMNNGQQPAFPLPPTLDNDGRICNEKWAAEGISKREYFASKAPSDIPEWFKHKEPEKNIPYCIPWDQIEDEKDRELYRAWVLEGSFDLPDHLVWFADDFNAAKESKELWEFKNKEARYFQWRTYYADAMLAALDNDKNIKHE